VNSDARDRSEGLECRCCQGSVVIESVEMKDWTEGSIGIHDPHEMRGSRQWKLWDE
jgi:hypothetical protein